MGLQLLKSVSHSSTDSKGRLAVSPPAALLDTGGTQPRSPSVSLLDLLPNSDLRPYWLPASGSASSYPFHASPHLPNQFTYLHLQILWGYSFSFQVGSVNMPFYLHLVWFSSVILWWFMSWDRWMWHFARSAAPSIFSMFSIRFWFSLSQLY